MASTTDVAIAVERHLVHHQREPRNRLASSYTAGGTSLTLEFDSPLPTQGQQLAVDFEVFETWGRDNRVVTVEGAQEGSTAADHAQGAHAVLGPKFPRNTILREVNSVLDDLSSPMRGLFHITTKDITFDAGVYAYDLDDLGDLLEVYDVAWRPVASTAEWRVIPRREWRVDRDLNTTDFPSGNALVLPGGIPNGYTVRVTYKASFAHVTAATSNVASTSGLPDTALDLLDLGAAVRLLKPLEPARNYTDSQGDTRRAEEVPPGALERSVRGLEQMYERRVQAEAARLRGLYPMVSRR